MSTQRKLRRGTKAVSDAFTGAIGETVFETDNNRLVNHDGSKAGGYPVPNFLDMISNYFKYASSTGTNTIVLTLPYAPTAYSAGMEIYFKPANTITAAATINVNGLGAKNIYKDNGSGTLVAVASGDIKANIPARCIYDGTQFVLQTGGSAGADIQNFTSSGTWTKPGVGSVAYIQIWGAGAGGGSNATSGGGGGGGYAERYIPLSALASTVSVTIGAGGAVNTTGGNSSFGSHVTAYGGGAGNSGSASAGGGGGGWTSKGANSATTTPGAGGGPWLATAAVATAGESSPSGGAGGGTGTPGGHSVYGGGGGGGGGAGVGGSTFHGGGGGAGSAGSAGTSVYGGDGGGPGSAGTAPAGGGGRNGAGARGECRVYTF